MRRSVSQQAVIRMDHEHGHHQSAYWDSVAEHISLSNCPNKDLVGYHSPYDLHVRDTAVHLLDQFSPLIPQKEVIGELGSGAGLNLRYFSQFHPRKLLAFDCSPQLLALAKSNLAGLDQVEFFQTSGYDLPVPAGTPLDLLFTVTVLQHVTDTGMYQSVVKAIQQAGPRYILLLEDTRRPARQVTADYTLRTPEEYVRAFAGVHYRLAASDFISLTWASRLFGLINRIYGLYNRKEGAQLPRPVFALTRLLSPLARLFDRLLPGTFGMSATLFERQS